MIFFNPYSTLGTIRDTYRFVAELLSLRRIMVQLLNGTKLHKKARDDVLLTDDYSFMNTEGYSFLHPEVKEIADFMRKEFIPQADSINNQYNTLSRLYASVRRIFSQTPIRKAD